VTCEIDVLFLLFVC